MKVLVTGGAGLIGFHIAKHYLAQGDEIVIMDNLERSRLLGHDVKDKRMTHNLDELVSLGAINYKYPDVSHEVNWESLAHDHPNIDVIFHMAAQCGVPTSIGNPRRDFEINTLGTFNMLEYAREFGSRVCYASTNKTYPLHTGWFKEGKRWQWSNQRYANYGFPVTACDNQGSRTPYGASKFAADILCQEYHHIYGVPTGIFRMSCIYGDHQFSFSEQGWATWFAIAMVTGKPITVYGDGCQVRDMLWVEDLVRAYDAFATSDTINHGVWNTGGGPHFTLSVNEAIEILSDLIGKKPKVTYEDWRTSDQRLYTSDIRPLKEDLGWEPKVSPMEGLEKVVRWVMDNEDLF